MRCFLYRIAEIFCIYFMTTSFAHAQQKLGLVIGNEAYIPTVGRLSNPTRDAALVSEALRYAGFSVKVVLNGKRAEILRSIEEYALELAEKPEGTIGFFYYSGHGVARPGFDQNYLIPTDVSTRSDDFWHEAIRLDDLADELKKLAPQVTNFLVFDACRDILRLPYKSANKGFVDTYGKPGFFIGFSTSPGEVASDVGETGGPYANALAKALRTPGLNHWEVFQSVKEQVYAASGHKQTSWEKNGLVRLTYLNGAKNASPSADASPAKVIGDVPAQANRDGAPPDGSSTTSDNTSVWSSPQSYCKELLQLISRPRSDFIRDQYAGAAKPARSPFNLENFKLFGFGAPNPQCRIQTKTTTGELLGHCVSKSTSFSEYSGAYESVYRDIEACVTKEGWQPTSFKMPTLPGSNYYSEINFRRSMEDPYGYRSSHFSGSMFGDKSQILTFRRSSELEYAFEWQIK